MDIGFVAVERFVPPQYYLEWSKLYHMKELISIDTCLCPNAFREIGEYDYSHIIWLGQYKVYNDLNYLLDKVGRKKELQILALAKDPSTDCSSFIPDNLIRFIGYDLFDDWVSAVSNCGGFDKAFLPEDISPYGLVEDYDRVVDIQQKLTLEYPDEPHANCSIFAIWRMER